MGFLIALGILCAVVVIHEMGHLVAYRSFGVTVPIFSIGMGKKLFGVRMFGTEFRLSMVPMGGYVMALQEGMDKELDESLVAYLRSRDSESLSPKRRLEASSPIARIVGAAAGPAANLLSCWMLLSVTFYFQGNVPTDAPVTIAEIQNGSAAQQAGLRIGDRIASVGGTRITSLKALKRAVFLNPDGAKLELTIARAGKYEQVSLVPKVRESGGIPTLGVEITEATQKNNSLPIAIGAALTKLKGDVQTVLGDLSLLVSGRISTRHMSGPIGIVSIGPKLMEHGLQGWIVYFVVISVALAIFNLVPFPVLDGSHIVLAGFELVGLAIPKRVVETVHVAGACALLVMMLYTTVNDVLRLIWK